VVHEQLPFVALHVDVQLADVDVLTLVHGVVQVHELPLLV